MKRVVDLLRLVAGVKEARAEAILHPFTPEQIDVIQFEVMGVWQERVEEPPVMQFNVWVVLVLRLLRTVIDQQAQLIRAHQAMEGATRAIREEMDRMVYEDA